MLVNAFHSSLEDAVVSFDRVCMNLRARHAVSVPVLPARMINRIVLGEFIAKLRVACGLIGHDMAFAVNIGTDDWQNVLFRDVLDMKSAGLTAAFNER